MVNGAYSEADDLINDLDRPSKLLNINLILIIPRTDKNSW